jgi:UDP-N-acetylmuramoyl-tripeptide--D-alanyl-D-alanine ligase
MRAGKIISSMDSERFLWWLRQVVLRQPIWHLQPVLYMLAYLWRRLLFRTTFVAITGSLGKTTAKECLASILGSRGRTYRTFRNQNGLSFVVLNILRVRPWHRYAVLELGACKPGCMEKPARLVNPDVALILMVGSSHLVQYGALDAIAADKEQVVRALRPGGIAVLNKDDARVAAMAARTRARVIFFGASPDADVQTQAVSASWPGRLTFHARYAGQSQKVETQLVGEHWLTAAAGVVAAAASLGISLADSAAALARVAPFAARSQPMLLPNGAVLLRDDYSATFDGVKMALRVMERASASRLITVMTDFADFDGGWRKRFRYLAPEVAKVAQVAVFIGEHAGYAAKRAVEAGISPGSAHAFPRPGEAAGFLRSELRRGDFVLLKGRTIDHLGRVYFAQFSEPACWKLLCTKTIICDICWELGVSAKDRSKATPVPPAAG